MLEIIVKKAHKEGYDEIKEEFISFDLDHDIKLTLEHSLVSISKWESKWHKPFLSDSKKTDEELQDYIRCMIVNNNVPEDIIYFLSNENLKQINSYIDNPMTATTFHTVNRGNNDLNQNKKQETLTSEVIYYWMIDNGIPVEFQKWHINRLLTLIRVCNIKNSSNNKMSKKDAMLHSKNLNQARRASRGVK